MGQTPLPGPPTALCQALGTKDTPFLFTPNQIFPFLCFISRGEMAEDQPHLCIQMSESGTNGIPSRMQSSPDLAGKAGSVLTFHNICYRVKIKTGFLCFKKTTKKEVLRDVKYVFKHLFRVCVSFISVWRTDFTRVTGPLSTRCRSRFRKIICMCGWFVFAVLSPWAEPVCQRAHLPWSWGCSPPGCYQHRAHQPALLALHSLAILPLSRGV